MSKVKMYIVGGYVRDKILGIPSKDIDYAVEAESFDLMRDHILSLGGEIFLETPEYLTIRARVRRGVCDYVLCRKDGDYVDGRHPESVQAGTIYDDLTRRDFTMNAIAIDEDGGYIDPHNGIQDIGDDIIRCVGNAEERMAEDYLRLLRAIRFSITKRMFIHDDIKKLLNKWEYVDGLVHVSEDRIREELHKMFSYDTIISLNILSEYPYLRDMIFSGNIWLMPTTRK